MKQKIFYILGIFTILMIISLASNFALANSETQEDKIYKDTQIKILPTINSNSVGDITADTNVIIISTTNNWAFIQKDDITGWVPLVFLSSHMSSVDNSKANGETTSDNNVTNTVENTTTDTNTTDSTTSTSGTDYEKKLTKYVNTTSIYVRSSASASSTILATLIKDTDVTVTGEDGEWYKVKYNDIVGYIRKDLLSDTKSTSSNTSSSNTTTSRSGDSVNRDTANNETTGSKIVQYAKQYLGCPYVYGASGSSSFDCSGFTMYIYSKFGYSLPHSASAQATYGSYVSKDNLQPGDLVFFLDYETMDGIGHCGIYIGDGYFIHASSGEGYCVKTSTLLSGSYLKRYSTARRLI